ncbi:telomere repeat binding factor-domain-containing protein [Xylogone sp. PMI_703]|nr:telomere repeat binding factor-domain-containing protein [Xylogone sp. PMI_703]
MEPVNEQAPLKYESPYMTESAADNSLESPLKRRLSTEFQGEAGEKRQRIETTKDDLDLAALIAQATASATQQFVESTATQENDNQQYHGLSSDLFVDNAPEQKETLAHNSGFSSDPHLYMRILSLPILESLSTQILSTLAQGPYEDTIRVVTEPSSELGQAYATLRSLFEQTKKIYSQKNSFLSADELNIRETEHRATIRTTNLATFMSGIFGGQDVGFYELNDQFIDSFTPEGAAFEKEPGQLYLNFKTQMYLSAVSQEEQEKSKEEVLDELFPTNMDQILLARHPEVQLSQSELDFIQNAKSRRDYLMTEGGDIDAIQALSERFSWEDFLRSLNSYLRETYDSLIAPYMKRHALTAPASPSRPEHINSTSHNNHNSLQTPGGQQPNNSEHDAIAQASLAAAQAALQGVGFGQYSTTQQPQPQQQAPQQLQQPIRAPQPSPYQTPPQATYQSHYAGANIPYHTQSAPTQVLYEQARQAAVAKANPHSRRPGLPSQRRPWSTEEENALMAGLDQVKGPHWSQILALYGAKGQISEILKDRNQVQLKDKARNLKLFFLKSNIEVPYYLQCVTGELKTRAPSQAARKEAEERARLASDEEQARFNGIMTLASGISQKPVTNEQAHTPDPTSQTQSPTNSQDIHDDHVNQIPDVPQPELPMEPPAPLSDEEQLRQHLMAATAAATASENQPSNEQSYGQVAPVAPMATMPS